MKKYKNLVFDVGSVLIGYRWKDMLIDHGLTEEEALAYGEMIFRHPLWLQFDLENLPYDEVVEQYVKAFPAYEDLTRWFLTRPEEMSQARPAVWERIGILKEHGYHLYILSNYSSLLFRAHTEGASFHNYMDGKVISYMIHEIKPDNAIYQYLFSHYDLKPEDCLFFDDREDNVQGSVNNGMDAVRVLSEDHLIELLDRIISGEELEIYKTI